MTNRGIANRKRQAAVPVKLRVKYKIEEGILKPKKSTVALAGSGAKYATPEEMKKLLDKLRGEDA